MGKRFRMTLWTFASFVGLLLIVFVFMITEVRRMRAQIYSTVHVVISLAVDADDVQKLDVDLCEMNHTYSKARLLDTISENLPTWAHEEHCPLTFTIGTLDGGIRKYQLDSLEHRTSGTHVFLVFSDSVSYDYRP